MTVTLLRGGLVFFGEAELLRADVLFGHEGIIEVAPNIDSSDPRVDHVLNVNGHTILPGLIDCHVHFVADGMDELKRLHEPYSYPYFRATRLLRETLSRGITTVRDAGGADLGLKQAVANGEIPGPDVIAAISIVGQTGGHSDGVLPSGIDFSLLPATPGRPSGTVDGADQMLSRVRELKRAGADVIKICTTGGVLSPGDDPRHSQLSVAEIQSCVDEASVTNTPVMAHAQGRDGVLNAVNCGVRSIEHGIFADDECFDAMIERGTWLVPTLIAPVALLRSINAGASISESVRAKAESVVQHHLQMVNRAIERGVRIAFGTDAGVFAHHESLDELGLLNEAGMPAHEVLNTATSSAAELLGLKDRGRIEVGLRADLVVLEGDPFNFQGFGDRVIEVFKNGVQHSQP